MNRWTFLRQMFLMRSPCISTQFLVCSISSIKQHHQTAPSNNTFKQHTSNSNMGIIKRPFIVLSFVCIAISILFTNFTGYNNEKILEPKSFSSFQKMNVCLDKSGKVLPTVAPGDADCVYQRDIKIGEMPTYRLHNYSAAHCTSSAGSIARVQIPIRAENGIVRYVSYTDRGATQCHPNSKIVKDFPYNG
jgi:hypothetical protein